MNPPDKNGSPLVSMSLFRDAMRYWEVQRVSYNLVLIAIAVTWIVVTWPHFRPAFTLQSLFAVMVLAALANLCYCFAYLVEIFLHRTSYRDIWRRRRWGLWLTGTLFAAMLEYYWIADEIYQSVG